MRALMEQSTRLAIDLDHPAYDCVYLALAVANGWKFVTTDMRLLSKVRQPATAARTAILSLAESVAGAEERH